METATQGRGKQQLHQLRLVLTALLKNSNSDLNKGLFLM